MFDLLLWLQIGYKFKSFLMICKIFCFFQCYFCGMEIDYYIFRPVFGELYDKMAYAAGRLALTNRLL